MKYLFLFVIRTFEFVSRLPMKVLYFYGNLILLLDFFPINPISRRITNNIKRLFPEYSPLKIRQIRKNTLKSFGSYAAEYLKSINTFDCFKWGIVNAHLLEESIRKNKITICLSGHFCGFDLLTAIPQYFKNAKFIFLYEQNNSVIIIDEWIKKIRERGGAELVAATKCIKAISTHLKNYPDKHLVIGCLSDLKPQKVENSVEKVSFLSGKTFMYNGIERIGYKYKAKFLYGAIFCKERGSYNIEFCDMTIKENTVKTITQEYAYHLAENIKANPQGWIPLLTNNL